MKPIDPIDKAEVARRFACKTPDKMKWTRDGVMNQCRGCPAMCGTSAGSMFRERESQADLFGQAGNQSS